jgi:hypothetical protein
MFAIDERNQFVFWGLIIAPVAVVHLAEFLSAFLSDALDAGNLFGGKVSVHFVGVSKLSHGVGLKLCFWMAAGKRFQFFSSKN